MQGLPLLLALVLAIALPAALAAYLAWRIASAGATTGGMASVERSLLWLAIALAVVLAVTFAYLACRCYSPRPVPPALTVKTFPGSIACPDHDGVVVWDADSAAKITTVKLAGATTLIPEFHDCQRLIDTAHKYGPLAALWVPQYLTEFDGLLAHGRPLAVALVHAWDGNYEPLGIQQGWNCLYMFIDQETQHLQARMVHIPNDSLCFGPAASNSVLGGQLLEVSQQHVPGFGAPEYPTVGRWDRDQDQAKPYDYIGLRCSAAWCEIHRDKGTPFLPSRNYALASAAPIGDRKVWEIKGWYDEQFLDVGTAGAKIPLQVLGTMVPDPALDTLTLKHFTGAWKRVGYSALSGPSGDYLTKLGLHPGTLPHNSDGEGLTEESLCLKTAASTCPDVPPSVMSSCKSSATGADSVWYARIGAVGPSAAYRCVTRHGHPGSPHIPGTGRWRWQENDATQWWRCDDGCCTIKP